MRYYLALAVALIVIAAGLLFAWRTQSTFRQRVQEGVNDAEQEAQARGAGGDRVDARDFGMEVTPGELRRIQLASILLNWWFAWVPLVLALCFAAAAIRGDSPP